MQIPSFRFMPAAPRFAGSQPEPDFAAQFKAMIEDNVSLSDLVKKTASAFPKPIEVDSEEVAHVDEELAALLEQAPEPDFALLEMQLYLSEALMALDDDTSALVDPHTGKILDYEGRLKSRATEILEEAFLVYLDNSAEKQSIVPANEVFDGIVEECLDDVQEFLLLRNDYLQESDSRIEEVKTHARALASDLTTYFSEAFLKAEGEESDNG